MINSLLFSFILYGGVMEVTWKKCAKDKWCTLKGVNIEHAYFKDRSGVFIIWFEEGYVDVVKVGHGSIKDQIARNRQDERVQLWGQRSPLFITWSEILPGQRNGVIKYLQMTLQPNIGDIYPVGEPIKVNLPWEEE